jgi:hypothetical protein
MGVELQAKLIPALSEMLKLQPAQLEAMLAANSPALAGALTTLPASMTQFSALVTAFAESLTDYNDINTTQFVPIIDTILATGGFLVLVGLLSAADLTRRRQTSGAIA